MTRSTTVHTTEFGASSMGAAEPTTGGMFRTLVVALLSATLTLTLWAGERAWAVEQRLDRVAHVVTHTPVRQIEQAQQNQAGRIDAARRHDEQRFANQASLSMAARSSQRYLSAMEYTELRRFRNITPAGALSTLDAEIERLRQVPADDGSARPASSSVTPG